MSGIKGRSGRRPLRDEERRLMIIDKAWNIVGIKLDSNDKDRFQIARDIVVKDITQHLKGEGFENKTFIFKWKGNQDTPQDVLRREGIGIEQET
jgi:hypothetical protein